MQLFGFNVHGGVDSATLALAVAMIPIRVGVRLVRSAKPLASTRKCIVDFLNGTAIVPFFLMLLAVASDDAFRTLQQSNMAFIGIAGGIGLLFVIGELIAVD